MAEKWQIKQDEAFIRLMGCNIPNQKKDDSLDSASFFCPTLFSNGCNIPRRITRTITITETTEVV